MLKEAPNSNDSMHIANMYVLNEVPNRNDSIGVANNVHLTTMGAIQFLIVAVYLLIIQKTNLPEVRDNNTKITKVCADRNKYCPGKE